MAKASPSNLCEAARAGDLNALKRAIQAGADLNAGLSPTVPRVTRLSSWRQGKAIWSAFEHCLKPVPRWMPEAGTARRPQ